MAGRHKQHTSSTIKIRESSIQHQRASALHVVDETAVRIYAVQYTYLASVMNNCNGLMAVQRRAAVIFTRVSVA
jgi:hypothetical protein